VDKIRITICLCY